MMMKELSLHIMDILQNSIVANATLITVEIKAQSSRDWMCISIRDNGRGMDEGLLNSVTNPFVTSRTTRKIGLGIPMFKAGAEAAGGSFQLLSKVNEGTTITAEYKISHLDRPPLGDIAETMFSTIIGNPEIDFEFEYTFDENTYRFDTRAVKEILGHDIPINMPDVALWIKGDLYEGINAINGGI